MVKKIVTKSILGLVLTVFALLIFLILTLISFKKDGLNEAELMLTKFSQSQESEIKLKKLFPWDWEYLCITGDYADFDSFELAMGRPLALSDKFKWLWYGANSDNEINIIFEGKDGVVKSIYPYFSYSNVNLDKHLSDRGHCIKKSENVVLKKEAGSMTLQSRGIEMAPNNLDQGN